MKKVSEVKRELEALGCHKDKAKDLLVACGVLEENPYPELRPLQVWKEKDYERYHIIVRVIDGRPITHTLIINGKTSNGTHCYPNNTWGSIDGFCQSCEFISEGE